METLLEFAKHETPKKSILQWIKESEQQKFDKFWEEHNKKMDFIRMVHAKNYLKVIIPQLNLVD